MAKPAIVVDTGIRVVDPFFPRVVQFQTSIKLCFFRKTITLQLCIEPWKKLSPKRALPESEQELVARIVIRAVEEVRGHGSETEEFDCEDVTASILESLQEVASHQSGEAPLPTSDILFRAAC